MWQCFLLIFGPSHISFQVKSTLPTMSSWEILTRRDGVARSELDLSDEMLSNLQLSTRLQNQASSAKNKASGGKSATSTDVSVGSLVYIKDDSSKLKARDRYIVVRKDGSEYTLKKLLKSNIRGKEYLLKSTEVYPVVSNIIHNESYLRGWDGVADEEDADVAYDESLSGRDDLDLHIPQTVEDRVDVDPFQYEETDNVDPLMDNAPPEDVSLPSTAEMDSDIAPAVNTFSTPAMVNAPVAPVLRHGARIRSRPPRHQDFEVEYST